MPLQQYPFKQVNPRHLMSSHLNIYPQRRYPYEPESRCTRPAQHDSPGPNPGRLVMQESNGDTREGKAANREYEEYFVNNLTAFRGAKVKSVAVDEESGIALAEWWMDFSLNGVGDVIQNQVSVQKWEDGKVVHERFYSAN